MEIGGVGSVQNGSDVYFAQGTHIIRVVVENSGSADGPVSLKLEHRGAANLAFSEVTTINLGTVAKLSTTPSIDISWDATIGDGQGLKISTVSGTDTNSGNNYRDLFFDVQNYYNGDVTGDTIPEAAPGSTDVMLGNAIQTFESTVVNSGTNPISAVMGVVMFEVGNASNTMEFWSGTVTLQAGTLMNPAISSTLATSFDATSITGTWNTTVSVQFNGTAALPPVEVAKLDIRFSNFRSELTNPSDRTLQPGAQTVMTFLVHNTGTVTDSFAIQISESNGLDGNQLEWTNRVILSGDSTATIPANSTYVLHIDISIPADATLNLPDFVTLTLTSVNAPLGESYVLRGEGRIVVGESFSATVDLPDITTKVLPGVEQTIMATITNTGNGASAFRLTAGLSVSALNWDVSVDAQTAIIPPAGTTQKSIKITPPPIQSPLNPGEFNRAGDTLSVWLQVEPVTSGLPAFDSALMQIRSILTVDPGLPEDDIYLTKDQVINSQNGVRIGELIELSIQARHNLASEMQEKLDATITVESISFKADNTGGFSEATRWSYLLTPQSVTNLDIGQSVRGSLTITGPDDAYPVAGTLSIAIKTSPTLTGGSGDEDEDIKPKDQTQNLTIIIPSLIDGEITNSDVIHDVNVGSNSSVPITFHNTGNDLASYRLRVGSELPDNWIVNFNGTDNIIDDLPSDISDGSLGSTLHIKQCVLNVLTDSLAVANSIEPITIRVEEKLTGKLIRTQTIEVRVGEVINGTLTPTNQTVDMSVTEAPFTLVTLSNAGNAPTDYSLWLDTSEAGEVEFNIEQPSMSSIFIAPGYEDTIRI
jgi:hypothetical protein